MTMNSNKEKSKRAERLVRNRFSSFSIVMVTHMSFFLIFNFTGRRFDNNFTIIVLTFSLSVQHEKNTFFFSLAKPLTFTTKQQQQWEI